ncbi:endolytic transglycosylase MltG [Hydrogenophaga sp. MI9]|uniref:endolytic transglycosylase MltG n=1 Tax=Hydrogenophaga sp. MI9 TaxID=3453719 RepID=UPI003EE8897D
MKRLFAWLLLVSLLLASLGGAGVWWWLDQPLALPAQTTAEAPLEVQVPPGSAARGVTAALADAGVQTSPLLLQAWFRLSGRARDIKAGTYALKPGATPRSLLDQLVKGEQALRSLTLLEGWNFRELMAAVRASPDLTQDLEGLDGAAVMARIGFAGRHPEGRFFPDTYRMVRQATASSVLRQAALAMEQRLALAWTQRDPSTPLRSPDEALILASIVEKETGTAADRAMVGGVFANRLRIGMRLQTDPTVIYGLGERFDGNLRRADLLADTPYNSYTRAGLPPTPIAMPGWASLMAAVRPADTRALYFVARGDGSSQFSATLDEHNAAVRRFQLQK